LVNLQGEVVGINTTILSRTGGNIGIAFAIPVDLAKPVISQLRTTGKVPRGWLGVTLQAVTPELAGLFGMDEARGALVAEVTKSGPAEAAGLQRGDIITTFNGVRIKEFRELLAMVARASVGDHVSVTFFRDGREKTVSVTLGEIPSRQVGSGRAEQRTEHWGMTLANVSPEHARRFRLERDQKGVVVIEIESGSPAELAGFRPGDVIERVNRQPIQSLEDFDAAATEAEDRDTVLLLVRRGGFASFNVLRRKEQQKAPQGKPDESFSLNDKGDC
jgi:serine protease Do